MKKMTIVAATVLALTSAKAQEIKLALQAYTFRDRSFVETVETAKRLGIKYIEMYPGQKIGGHMEGTTDYKKISPEALEQLKLFIDDSGIKVICYGVAGAYNEEQWDQLAAFAHTIGIETIQTEISPDRGKFDLAEKMAKKHGLKVAIHNHRQEYGRPEGILEQLKGRGQHVGAGCDIGHWMRVGVEPLDGVKLLKGKWITMHLVDVERIEDTPKLRDVPYGQGAGRLNEVLDELKRQRFSGYVTLEYEHLTDKIEQEVGECVAWFNDYQKGKR
jgi:L-ribulose-5-phosphate 3-epimerase